VGGARGGGRGGKGWGGYQSQDPWGNHSNPMSMMMPDPMQHQMMNLQMGLALNGNFGVENKRLRDELGMFNGSSGVQGSASDSTSALQSQLAELTAKLSAVQSSGVGAGLSPEEREHREEMMRRRREAER
jgi:hypothetical protein